MASNGMNTFSATECIKFGWTTFKKRPWFLIGISVLLFVVSMITTPFENNTEGVVRFVVQIVSWVISMLVGIAYTAFFLRAHEDVEHVTLRDAWKPEFFLNYLAASILVMIAVVIGFILLIVPGVILALMFSQTFNLIIDRNMGPIEAMKESARITKGFKWELFLLWILSVGVIIIGLICLLVGFFVAMPVIMLASIHAYRTLAGKADAIVPATPGAPEAPSSPVVS